MWNEHEEEFSRSQGYQADPLEWLASNWQGAAIGSLLAGRPYNQTGVKKETLLQVNILILYRREVAEIVLRPIKFFVG